VTKVTNVTARPLYRYLHDIVTCQRLVDFYNAPAAIYYVVGALQVSVDDNDVDSQRLELFGNFLRHLIA